MSARVGPVRDGSRGLARGDTPGVATSEDGERAAEAWDRLSEGLAQPCCLWPLREHLRAIRTDNYTAGPVVSTSVHEAIRELARRAWLAFRETVACREPGRLMPDHVWRDRVDQKIRIDENQR